MCSCTVVILCPKVIPLICCLLSFHLFLYKDWSVNIWIRGSLDNCSEPKATENITLSRFLFHSCLLYLWTFRLTLGSLDVKSVTRFLYMSCLLEPKAWRNLFWANFQHLSWKKACFHFCENPHRREGGDIILVLVLDGLLTFMPDLGIWYFSILSYSGLVMVWSLTLIFY
jgi:hypothetical protein